MAILEISVIPIGTDNPSIGKLVTESCKSVRGKQLEYKITPTSTIVEGSLDDLLEVARQMHIAPFKMGVDRVITSIKLDDRLDKSAHMDDMVEEIMDKM